MKNWLIAAMCLIVLVALFATMGATGTQARETFQMALSADGFVVAVTDTRSGETHIFDVMTNQEYVVFGGSKVKVSGALGGGPK
jgi:hypothetical protein